MKYLEGVIAMIVIFLLIIFFAGTPDLSDSIRGYIDAKTDSIKQETSLTNKDK